MWLRCSAALASSFTLFLLFLRFIPMIAMFEVKTNLPENTESTQPSASDDRSASIGWNRAHRGGLLASFRSAEATRAAVRQLRDKGYQVVDAMSPFPIHGMPRLWGLQRSGLPPWSWWEVWLD